MNVEKFPFYSRPIFSLCVFFLWVILHLSLFFSEKLVKNKQTKKAENLNNKESKSQWFRFKTLFSSPSAVPCEKEMSCFLQNGPWKMNFIMNFFLCNMLISVSHSRVLKFSISHDCVFMGYRSHGWFSVTCILGQLWGDTNEPSVLGSLNKLQLNMGKSSKLNQDFALWSPEVWERRKAKMK